MVSLPDAENRRKILQVILGKEELSDSFDFNELSQLTDGYSGSDLKVGRTVHHHVISADVLGVLQRKYEGTVLRSYEMEVHWSKERCCRAATSLSLFSRFVGPYGTRSGTFFTNDNHHRAFSPLLLVVGQRLDLDSASFTLHCCCAESVCHSRISANQRDLGAGEEGRNGPTSTIFRDLKRFFLVSLNVQVTSCCVGVSKTQN
jgi:hypothetical protein